MRQRRGEGREWSRQINSCKRGLRLGRAERGAERAKERRRVADRRGKERAVGNEGGG